MTADVELLPLPEMEPFATHGSLKKWASDYARANIAHATAAKDAVIVDLQSTIEALRAEVAEARDVLRKSLDADTDGEPLRALAIRASNALYWRTERADQAEARAERLAEALRLAMDWNWLDDDARPSRTADICDAALNPTAAQGDEAASA